MRLVRRIDVYLTSRGEIEWGGRTKRKGSLLPACSKQLCWCSPMLLFVPLSAPTIAQEDEMGKERNISKIHTVNLSNASLTKKKVKPIDILLGEAIATHCCLILSARFVGFVVRRFIFSLDVDVILNAMVVDVLVVGGLAVYFLEVGVVVNGRCGNHGHHQGEESEERFELHVCFGEGRRGVLFETIEENEGEVDRYSTSEDID